MNDFSEAQLLVTRRGSRGGRWGARPPLGISFTIQNTLFNSIQAPVQHWAPTPGRNPVFAPDNYIPKWINE